MSSAHSDPLETSGMPRLTQDQRDQSFRTSYWDLAIRYGIQYYVAGRFAAASGFTPVTANLLHHALELLLKACLAYDDPSERIRQYGKDKNGYRHDLPRLWQEFKKRNAVALQPEFDRIIEELHKFDEIRYPEQLIDGGATIITDIFANEEPPQKHQDKGTLYVMKLPEVDELMGVLLKATHWNRELLMAEVNDERRRLYYDKLTSTLFGLGNESPPE